MEISKSLQEEILSVQNKLKNAIRDHQICVGKLKDDPNNTDILGQIQKIHLHIVSLGRCQKQVVQRLRKEVETFKAQNANGAKVSIASLLGLNNNNHITNNNDTKCKTVSNDFSTKSSKEDYEEIVRNGDVPSPTQDTVPPKERSRSVETISGEDDVIEVSMDENSNEKSEKEESEKECKAESMEKINFLNALGLITTATCSELQNKRAERKRRSTANPHFVYSNLELPTKRKRHSYLQSGNVPQTRQTTARLNGPSPPPVKVAPPKSTSPPASKAVLKSLIPVQKSTTRPNILRSVTESKVFPNKSKVENGPGQIQLPTVPTVKSVQSIGNKAVHIPGLPSSLTIERISSDSAVCISCRNPGTLTVCENCASNYHVSCHSISPAPQRICPKCALLDEEEIEDGDEADEEEDGRSSSFKKDEEFATTAHAPGIIRKTREDAEIYKTSCGLHKADAAQKKRGFSSSIGIGQLPASTFLIPLSSNSVSATTINQPDVGPSSAISIERENSVPYSSIVLNQLPRSNITYIDRTESQVSYAYPLPPLTSSQSDKHQSYLIVKKITEPARRAILPIEDQSHATMFNYKLPIAPNYKPRVQTEISVAHTSLLVGKQLSDPVSRNRKKQTSRAVPALNRIIDSENLSITAEYQLERSTFNGRKSRAKQPRNKFGVNQLRSVKATEILLPSYDNTESDKQLQIAKSTEPEEAASLFGGRPKYRPRAGSLLHSLFTSHNKSYIVTDNSREPRDIGPGDKDTNSLNRQQLHRQDYQLEPGERNESSAQLQRGALTKFFEHVKLEEAHIPAPSRAKLVYKRSNVAERNELEVTEIADEESNSHEYDNKTSSSLSIFEDDFALREAERNNWLPAAVIEKLGEKNDNTGKSTECFDSVSNFSRSNDVITYKRKRSNNKYFLMDCESDFEEKDNAVTGTPFPSHIASLTEIASQSQRDLHDTEPLRNAQSNFLELRNEVSVPDDKADSERQDLSSGRRSTSCSRSSSTSDSDTPEQAMDNSLKYSRRRLSDNTYKERLGINAVSPESMQVLEQFESAMRETGCSNAATC
ncbi:uncharacterized protein LOC117600068 [Osmia lignaria lignaria]|uniref:uncharacterized protein LOC117600068 n=1 Tax=Osmia lignaria lignaria TaxID=1437193 RepID=UPI00402B64AB